MIDISHFLQDCWDKNRLPNSLQSFQEDIEKNDRKDFNSDKMLNNKISLRIIKKYIIISFSDEKEESK